MAPMIETESAQVSLRATDVVLVRLRPDVELEPRHADEIVRAAERLCGSTPHGTLVDVRAVRFISHETRQAFARARGRNVRAVAVLVESSLQRTMGNLYLTVSRPTLPTRLFSAEADAIEWLRAGSDVPALASSRVAAGRHAD
jgi:hypothetical protein